MKIYRVASHDGESLATLWPMKFGSVLEAYAWLDENYPLDEYSGSDWQVLAEDVI